MLPLTDGRIVACMGANCKSRETCAHYHSADTMRVERLCFSWREEPEPMEPQPKAEEAR